MKTIRKIIAAYRGEGPTEIVEYALIASIILIGIIAVAGQIDWSLIIGAEAQ